MLTIDKNKMYSGKKLKAALAMAEGTKTQREISKELGIQETSLSRWKRDPDYIAYVDKLTLEHEAASRAGLLRRALKGMSIKSKNIHDDKNTHLDYLKEIADLQGYKKQHIEHSGGLEPANSEHVVVYIPVNGRDEVENSDAD